MVKLKFTHTEDYLEFLTYLEVCVTKEVKKQEEEDRLSGSHTSSSRLLAKKLDIYIGALNKKIPKDWEAYYLDFIDNKKKLRDPEYTEYLRLKDKFKGANYAHL